MNTQEREQLSQLLKQLVEFKVSTKDPEADSLIHDAVARQPDAAYLLVQRIMLLELGLHNAKARIEDLQKQLQAGQSSASFLGSDPWAAPAPGAAPVPGAGNYQPSRYAPPAPAQAAAQPQSGGFLGGGGSSFLGSVASTAAGVAAGGLLFQGLENLFGHHGGYGQLGQTGFGQQSFGEAIPEQTTVINNYYGDDNGNQDQQLADYSDYGNDSFGDDSGFSDDGSTDF